jgi:hypothetical protein
MADGQHTGGMIALIPRAEDAARLTIPGGEKADDLHLTLAYLGDDVTEMPSSTRNAIVAAIVDAATMLAPVEARVFGHAAFNPDGYDGHEPCTVYLVGDSWPIEQLHIRVREGLPPEIRAVQHAPFIAHVTARYGAIKRLGYTGSLVFDRLSVAFADETYDFPLGDTDEKSIDVRRVEVKRMRVPDTPAPIASVKDLGAAIAAFGELDFEAKDRVRRDLIGAARRLNAENMLPEPWTRGALTDAELVEAKVMSPDPNAAKLREYWAHGKGRSKWHDWDSLRRHLAKYVKNPRILDGLTANIYKLATGRWPGARRGEKSMAIINADEWKTALLLTDPDAELPGDAEAEAEADKGESDDEDEIYEQALIDEVRWDIDEEGTPEREGDDGEPPSTVRGPRPPMISLFD